MQQPIAILDSGVGGLTVAKEVMRQLPLEPIIYFGDTARAPYGPREPEQIKGFTVQIVSYLMSHRPKMIVIACNTATAIALEHIRDSVPVPVIGVIHPGARAAIKMTRNGRIGVIGTEGTIQSGAYEQALKDCSPQIEIVSLACPLLVPLVEKGMFNEWETRQVVGRSLQPLQSQSIDCLILGCTHYPFLSEVIAEVMGSHVTLISSADETAREISTVLFHQNNLSKAAIPPEHQFFCSGDPHMFRKIAQQLLGDEIKVRPAPWPVSQIV